MRRLMENLKTERGRSTRMVCDVSTRLFDTAPELTPSIQTISEYIMKATVSVSFFSNAAQMESARRDAEKMLQRAIYRDMIDGIDMAKMEIHAGDYASAMAEINRLIAMATGSD